VHGDSAGELFRVAVDADAPHDFSGETPVRIPFGRLGGTLGSLAVHPDSGALFLGEENGTQIWRVTADGGAELYASGLRRLAGGSTLAFDRDGRLIVIDYVDPMVSPPADRLPPGLEQLREEAYRGPLVLRLTLDPTLPLPRRLDNAVPAFPRAWGGRAGGRLLPQLISVAPLASGDLLLLASTGDLHRLASDGTLTAFARLPRGQYHRTHMVTAPDGTVYVSGGFHVGEVFRITRDGAVGVIASNLADPAGIAVDDRGAVYIAESSLHRILRVR
jgi:sugar lactone lactonase YvrE